MSYKAWMILPGRPVPPPSIRPELIHMRRSLALTEQQAKQEVKISDFLATIGASKFRAENTEKMCRIKSMETLFNLHTFYYFVKSLG